MPSDNDDFGDCGGPYDLSDVHSISCWESQLTTCAEEAVIRYLAGSSARYWDKTLLHVGIGNGALFASIGAELRAFTGITISRPELEFFAKRFAGMKNARAILANKHDERVFDSIGNHFDIIVDVNLKSYACCEKHFGVTMLYFANCLSRGGMLVTAESGLEFGWAGNTAVAYTPGADTDPRTSRHRILGADGLAQLGIDLNLAVESVPVQFSGRCNTETLWVLTKA
jgi:hypothetical protein